MSVIIYYGDVMSTFICQQDIIALKGEQLDNIFKINGTISAYFEDIAINGVTFNYKIAKIAYINNNA